MPRAVCNLPVSLGQVLISGSFRPKGKPCLHA